MERIHFTAPDGAAAALDAHKVPNTRNRSEKICSLLNIEQIIASEKPKRKEEKKALKAK